MELVLIKLSQVPEQLTICRLIFLLQGGGVVYQALDHGYDSSGSKTRIVEAIGRGLAQCITATLVSVGVRIGSLNSHPPIPIYTLKHPNIYSRRSGTGKGFI